MRFSDVDFRFKSFYCSGRRSSNIVAPNAYLDTSLLETKPVFL